MAARRRIARPPAQPGRCPGSEATPALRRDRADQRVTVPAVRDHRCHTTSTSTPAASEVPGHGSSRASVQGGQHRQQPAPHRDRAGPLRARSQPRASRTSRISHGAGHRPLLDADVPDRRPEPVGPKPGLAQVGGHRLELDRGLLQPLLRRERAGVVVDPQLRRQTRRVAAHLRGQHPRQVLHRAAASPPGIRRARRSRCDPPAPTAAPAPRPATPARRPRPGPTAADPPATQPPVVAEPVACCCSCAAHLGSVSFRCSCPCQGVCAVGRSGGEPGGRRRSPPHTSAAGGAAAWCAGRGPSAAPSARSPRTRRATRRGSTPAATAARPAAATSDRVPPMGRHTTGPPVGPAGTAASSSPGLVALLRGQPARDPVRQLRPAPTPDTRPGPGSRRTPPSPPPPARRTPARPPRSGRTAPGPPPGTRPGAGSPAAAPRPAHPHPCGVEVSTHHVHLLGR